MATPEESRPGIVADGCERGRRAMGAEVEKLRSEFISGRFGDSYEKAGWFARRRMEREADRAVAGKLREIEETFPPDALYLASPPVPFKRP